jgi:hypothetical protein
MGFAAGHLSRRGPPLAPRQWIAKLIPENWVYTDGSHIKGQPRLNAAVVHIPIRTIIYTHSAETEEIRTITRAVLVAIHTALTTFASHDWVGIFTNSLYSLQAIRRHNTNTGIRSYLHYHHHMLLLESITDLLEARRLASFHTTMHTIRAHTNVRGNDLTVWNFDTLQPAQTTQVDVGKFAPRSTHWVMYTVEPPGPD